MGDGTGTFIKIDFPLLLKVGYIISFGDSHMHVNILEDEDLIFKFLDGPKMEE